ncbi:probable membrane-associated kinase regulator 2 isoform X1 [Musa acuminata AAA Group]|uniref:probable membrane-associated kinase regulator 2 isoform X1 n=1 Tax=Musa acuminata AAA Group TaxID=214697 RepID=UPI0031D7E578
MEFLRLLAHGKRGGGAKRSFINTAAAATIATTVLRPNSDDGGGDSEDEGPFFDLEFPLPLREEDHLYRQKQQQFSSDTESYDEEEEEEEEEDEEFDLTVSPDRCRYGRGFSSRSEDLFFKGRLVPLEPSSLRDLAASGPKASKPQVTAFLLKSAAKFRVFRLGFHRKSNSASTQTNPVASPATTSPSPKQQHQNKFSVKFKVEETPLASLFTRDSSSRSSSSSRSVRFFADDGLPTSEARKLPKDVLQRYISKIKPLYINISKRYGGKLRFSGPLRSGGAWKVRPAGEGGEASGGEQLKEPASAAGTVAGSLKSQDGTIPAGLKVVCRRLRKSRSASAAVASVRSPPLATGRRDDSLLEQQDGIQSAIAHCKRSFNRGMYGSESPLMRSRSDPGEGRSVELASGNNV